jgi:hypothetical protein
MRTCTYLLPLLCLVAPAALAQANFKPGYIVRTLGDTVRGEVDARSEQRNRILCRFRLTKEGTISEYQPAQLRGYGYSGGSQYQSRSLPGNPSQKAFVQVIVLGRVSIYKTVQVDDRDLYYAAKTSDSTLYSLIQRDTVMMVRSNATASEVKAAVRSYPFRSQLASLMADCPQVQPTIATMELREQKLVQVANSYNKCVGDVAPAIKTSPKNKPSFSLLVGALQSHVELADNDQTIKLKADPAVILGMGIGLRPRMLHYKVSILLQALYSKQAYYEAYSAYGEGIFTGVLVNKEAKVNFTSIRVPAQIRYTILQGGIRPYVQAGVTVAYHTQAEAQVATETRLGTSTRQIALRSAGFGPTAGLGVSIPVFKTHSLQLEARAEWLDGSSEATRGLSGAQSVALTAGYTFGQ